MFTLFGGFCEWHGNHGVLVFDKVGILPLAWFTARGSSVTHVACLQCIITPNMVVLTSVTIGDKQDSEFFIIELKYIIELILFDCVHYKHLLVLYTLNSYTCLKIALLFFLSINTLVWHTGFSAAQHNAVCLDVKFVFYVRARTIYCLVINNSSGYPLDGNHTEQGCDFRDQSWCLHVPKIYLSQYVIGLVVFAAGYCTSSLICQTIVTKILGPWPQVCVCVFVV